LFQHSSKPVTVFPQEDEEEAEGKEASEESEFATDDDFEDSD
jgi:hypothetical protein